MTVTAEHLTKILADHALWLRGDTAGARAVLMSADLTRADLRGADLTRADLTRAVLRGADLTEADLTGADLSRAVLTGADLSRADLRGADLTGADLSRAVLTGADLSRAVLTGAIGLSPLVAARLSIVPEQGAFDGWKKCCDGVLVRLRIPEDAKRSNGTERKCRAERALVVEIIGATEGVSLHDGTTSYRVGETVQCHAWDEDRWNTCGGGIHFYLTRLEAEAHV